MAIKLNPTCGIIVCCEGAMLPRFLYLSLTPSPNGPCQEAADNLECTGPVPMVAGKVEAGFDYTLPVSGGGWFYTEYFVPGGFNDPVTDSFEFCNGNSIGFSCSSTDVSSLQVGIGPGASVLALDNDGATGTFVILSCSPFHAIGRVTVPAIAGPTGSGFIATKCRQNMDGSTDEETFDIEVTE